MNSQHEIQGIGVQVLTSAEMTLLVLKDPRLLNNMLATLKTHMQKLAFDPRDRVSYFESLMIIIDIKYMARPECL